MVLTEQFPCRMTDMRKPRKGNAVTRLDGDGDVHDLASRQFPSVCARCGIGDRCNIRTRGRHALSLRDLRLKADAKAKRLLTDVGERPTQCFLRLRSQSMHPRERIRDRRRRIHADRCSDEKRRSRENALDQLPAGRRCLCYNFHNIPQMFGCVDARENTARTRVSVNTVTAP